MLFALDLTLFSLFFSLLSFSLSHLTPTTPSRTHPAIPITIILMKTSFVVGLLSLAIASQAAMTR